MMVSGFLGQAQTTPDRTILAPVLDGGATSACANSFSNNIPFSFRYTGLAYFADNEFFLEMSDANGDFTNPVVVSEPITGENSNFTIIDWVFQMPDGTAGDGYKIRVRSTSPEVIGEESELFSFYLEPDFNIGINTDGGNTICNDVPVTLNVTLDGETTNVADYQYAWYFNNNLISGERGSSISVNQPGNYFVSFYLGDVCTDVTINTSNVVGITSVNVDNLFIEGIQGLSTAEICSDETYELTSSIDNINYVYNWYKDDVLLVSGYFPTFITPDVDQFGVYRLDVDPNSGECITSSQNITVQQPAGSEFTLTIDSDTRRVILPNETIVLNVEDDSNSSALTYSWYRNDEEMFVTTPNISIIEEGEYFVVVTDNSLDCPSSQTSDTYVFLDAVSLIPNITSGDYESCNTESASLSLVGFDALATDGLEYTLTSDQINSVDFEWLKDSSPFSTLDDIDINSYVDNAEYELSASVGFGLNQITGSTSIGVLLRPDLSLVSSSESNQFFPVDATNGTATAIELSIDILPGFDYTWFKDDEELLVSDISLFSVTSPGEYYVTYEGFGCLNQTESVVINEFKNDRIPNVITPFNNDAKNDTWKIPSRLAFQSSVNVILYNSRGVEILNTNQYQNNWPEDINDVGDGVVFYYKIIEDNSLIIAGTISVLK